MILLKTTIHNWYNHLKIILRWVNMRASYWTAIGTMLIPLGVVLLIEVPTASYWAFWIIVTGFISFIAGWSYTVNEERESKKQRIKDEKRRNREHKENLIVLAELASKNRLSTIRLRRLIEELTKDENDG